jgi:hypothetical protein
MIKVNTFSLLYGQKKKSEEAKYLKKKDMTHEQLTKLKSAVPKEVK